MSFTDALDAKERVRQAIDIVELIGGYVQLRREGRNYKAICPWHDDTRPSLQINPQRQSFKCWVCNIGGDIFSFMMKMENVDFAEALALLAERAGIALKPSRTGGSTDEKRPLYEAMKWAEERFHRCLLEAPEAEVARKYLAERNITPESIRKYRLGFAPDRWDWLLNQALSSDISPKLLETNGLIARSPDSPRHYDRFRGRVLFPIHDVQGRPVAIGGRILPELARGKENLAKYVNSPETPLFSKSSMLYGLDSARDAIGRTRVAVVMEGYTDTIIARQAGFDNTVAVLGTALGERHIPLLRRFADSITLVLDGDEAGQRRANEILGLFIAQQVDLKIVTLPDGLDPADFLLQRGVDAFSELLDSAADALEHKLRQLDEKLGTNPTTHQVHQAIEEMLATMAQAPRTSITSDTSMRLREHQVLGRLSRQFGVMEEELRLRLGDLRRAAQAKRSEASEPDRETRPLVEQLAGWERELLEIMMLAPEALPAAAEVVRPEQMETPPARRLFGRCCELSSAGITPTFDRLLLEFDEPEMKNLLVDLDERVHEKNTPDVDAWMKELLARLERRYADRQLDNVVRQLKEQKQAGDDELELLNHIIAEERTRQGISLPTEG